MRSTRFVIGAIGLALVSSAFGADLVGSYTGTYKGHKRPIGVTLTIENVDGEIVRGTASTTSTGCVNMAMRGKLKGDQLAISAAKDAPCSLRLRLHVEDSKLVGTAGSDAEITLSRK